MRQLHIESLFGGEYPHASFHDSTIRKIAVDFLTREAKFDCVVFVGDPDDREAQPREASGILTFTGLLYITAGPPSSSYPYEEGGLEISYDGPVETTNFKAPIPTLPETLPEDAFTHCFFVNNWNSFMFIAATGAHFEWSRVSGTI
ncbi:MAG TPA: hypothetical protein VGX48_21800 [Pyrinomonadaceae bacterium]|nr:hypothetical protein [Pyrinomonadaceae bacterium]